MKHTIVLALLWCLGLGLFVACEGVELPEITDEQLATKTYSFKRADGTEQTYDAASFIQKLIELNPENLESDTPEGQFEEVEKLLVLSLTESDKASCPLEAEPDGVPSGNQRCFENGSGVNTWHYCVDGKWWDTGEECVPPSGTGN